MGFFDTGLGEVAGAVISTIAPPAGAMIGAGQQNQANWDLTQSANQASQASADKQMAFQADQAQKQKDYETNMSNTAYQRSMADAKAAGINPMLVASNGGSSTPSVGAPSGASAKMDAPSYTSPVAGAASSVVESAKAAASLMSSLNNMKLTDAQTKLTDAQTEKTGADTVNLKGDNPWNTFKSKLGNYVNGVLDQATQWSAKPASPQMNNFNPRGSGGFIKGPR